MSPYVDPQTVHNPAPGEPAPAAWGDVLRDDLEFLISPPQCSFEHSTTQSVADSTWTTLNGNTENYDTDGMHVSGANNSRATAQTAGKYLFVATVFFTSSAVSSFRQARLLFNGATPFVLWSGAGANFDIRGSFVRALTLGVGDYVECQVWQNTTGGLACRLLEMNATFLTR